MGAVEAEREVVPSWRTRSSTQVRASLGGHEQEQVAMMMNSTRTHQRSAPEGDAELTVTEVARWMVLTKMHQYMS